ncbi:transposase [Glycomyces sp. NPDC046736]|uniref:transposase n=1 Tax=Glycomyces sp. NPDC046736 TaxID=3155615 RepID=UPI0033D37CB2
MRLVSAAFSKGTLAIRVREVLGPVFVDEWFRSAFSGTGRPAIAPGRMALVSVLQCIEGLSDRATAEAFERDRIDSIARGLNRTEFVAETLRLELEALPAAARK